jgi:hypothetical protein
MAGKDKIVATLLSDSSIKDENSIVTRVKGLERMDGSGNCNGGGTYFFENPQKHACLFYGTPSTNDAILRISNDFVQRRRDCGDHPGSLSCKVAYNGRALTVVINGYPEPLKITAMSLPWGVY